MAAPRSPWHLAWVCNRLALQGFGGVLALAQREYVEREQWLSHQEFLEMLAVAQVLPGPNIINLSIMLGDRHFGWRGVLAALAGMLFVPGLIVVGLVLAAQVGLQHAPVKNALRGMALVASGLMLGACWKFVRPLKASILGAPWALTLAAAGLVLSAVLRWPLVWVVLGVGGLGMAMAYRKARG